jgi:hypothetical protein
VRGLEEASAAFAAGTAADVRLSGLGPVLLLLMVLQVYTGSQIRPTSNTWMK